MSTTFEAVYENGMLRLIEPILLPEGTHVEVTVMPKGAMSETKSPAEILATIAAITTATGDDEYSSRDHDKILYGEQGAA